MIVSQRSSILSFETTRINDLVHGLSRVIPELASPSSALYFFLSLESLGATTRDSVQFCTDLLAQCNVAAVPGSIFGKEGYCAVFVWWAGR